MRENSILTSDAVNCMRSLLRSCDRPLLDAVSTTVVPLHRPKPGLLVLASEQVSAIDPRIRATLTG